MDLPIAKTGVVVVDLQGDFTQAHNGSLSVEDTRADYVAKVVAATNQLHGKGYCVFATQDFHPENHISFFTNHENKSAMDVIQIDGRDQVLWPPHCVQGTPGAQVLLDLSICSRIVKKGCDPQYDSYSGFFDDGGADTGLADALKAKGIRHLIMYGLATDYCVKATAIDAIESGFRVILVQNLCRGVAPETTASALKLMSKNKVQIVSFSKLVNQ